MTIERAQKEVRKLNENNFNTSIVVYLREGIYYIESTLKFDIRDLGTKGNTTMKDDSFVAYYIKDGSWTLIGRIAGISLGSKIKVG